MDNDIYQVILYGFSTDRIVIKGSLEGVLNWVKLHLNPASVQAASIQQGVDFLVVNDDGFRNPDSEIYPKAVAVVWCSDKGEILTRSL